MKKFKILHFLKEFGALITYCLVINVILSLFYFLAGLIEQMHLINLENNVAYIIGYALILIIVLLISRIIEPYKFSKKADDEFIRNYLKISAEPNYFSEICVYLISVLCTFALGLALGSQGPSLYIGILSSLLIYKFIFKTSSMSVKEQILLDGSVGYSIAFMNPIAGMTLALERSKFKISMTFILKLSFALIFSFFLQYLMNFSYLCEYFIHLEGHMNYWLLFIVPIFVIFACGSGLLFKRIFREIKKHINHENKIVKIVMYGLIILIPLLIKIYNPYLLGGGLLTTTWIFSDAALGIVALYGLIRILFTLFSFETKFSGGMGGCIIIVGAIIGRILAGLLGLVIPLTQTDYFVLSLATALPFYGITTREKYTSFALIFSFGNFIYLIAPCSIGFLTMMGISETYKAIKKRQNRKEKILEIA